MGILGNLNFQSSAYLEAAISIPYSRIHVDDAAIMKLMGEEKHTVGAHALFVEGVENREVDFQGVFSFVIFWAMATRLVT